MLVTPACNEEQYIRKTLQSVTEQTVPPRKWVIISDGSTDRTEEIVKEFSRFPWIQLLRKEQDGARNFGSKVRAIKMGYDLVKDEEYGFIGFTDADVSFDKDFFETLLGRFDGNETLGIAGGVINERKNEEWQKLSYSYDWSVAGAMQMFRRRCYREIGGYLELERGGIDMIAEVMARRKGWSVQTFADLNVYHYHRTGEAKGRPVTVQYKRGVFEYTNGYSMLFQAVRFFTRLIDPPFVIGSVARTIGYLVALLKRERFVVPLDVVQYMRKEQKRRLMKTVVCHK